MAETKDSAQILRPAEDVLADLWRALWSVDTIRSLDMSGLSMSIRAGELLLEGHLASETSRRHIRAIAQDVPGVSTVHDHLVVDGDLAVEVAQALAADERTCRFILPVTCHHGWIRLGGCVPDRQALEAAETIAAQVPHGRGVVALPIVTGEPPTPLRRALQPRPGARVWGEDGELGRVGQVVIHPKNRLVTDVIIAPSQALQTRSFQGGYVVPIEAIEIANADSVFLTHPHRSITGFPVLDRAAYPQAPAAWSPPYPYRAGDVRWRQETPRPNGEDRTAGRGAFSRIRNDDGPAESLPATEAGPERVNTRNYQGGAS